MIAPTKASAATTASPEWRDGRNDVSNIFWHALHKVGVRSRPANMRSQSVPDGIDARESASITNFLAHKKVTTSPCTATVTYPVGPNWPKMLSKTSCALFFVPSSGVPGGAVCRRHFMIKSFSLLSLCVLL